MSTCLIFLSLQPKDILIQLIGFAAMTLGILSYQAKRRNTILLMQMLGSILWSIQFYGLGAYTGMALNAVVILRNTLYAQRGKRAWAECPLLPACIMAAFLLAGVLTWEGPISLLPMVAMIISTVALYIKDERRIRLLSLFVSPPWLIYDALCFSLGGVLTEVFTIVSILIALWRFKHKKD